MALKKSELYSSLWASCDELRGGMDASQYKDYVLVLLFVLIAIFENPALDFSKNRADKRALYNNLNQNEDLALKIDAVVQRVRPNAFRGNQPKENVIKAAMLPLLGNDRAEVERIFLIIKAQPEY
jgi:type I restriction-modification system DNA methylase subunit